MTDKQLATLISVLPFAALAFAFLVHDLAEIAARLRAERVAIRARAERKGRR